MKKSTIFASIGIVVFVGVIAVSITKIAGNARQTGSVGTATRGSSPALTAFYVVCEEFDKYGVSDKARAAGTVAMVFNRNPSTIGTLTFSVPGLNDQGAFGISDSAGNKVGIYLVRNDVAKTGGDVVFIEPGQINVPVVDGSLISYYCKSATSGKAGSPVVGSYLHMFDALGAAVNSEKINPISSFSSASWNLTMFGHIFSGTAHQVP